jgi:hypothetical protein
MATAQERLTAIENKLLETDPSDVGTIELLKDEHARTRARVTPTRPALAAPAGAAGAPTGSGKGGGERVADALGIAAMAPAKGISGVIDLGIFLGSKADKALGLLDKDFEPPYLTPMVDEVANEISGRKIPQSIGRSVLEGAITAPLSGAKTAGGLAQAALAGGVGGGVSEYVTEKGGHPLLAAAAGMAAGGTAAAIPQLRGVRLKEALVESRLRHSTKGIPEARLREGIGNHAEARGEGMQLLPSQALDVDAPGLQNLQGALLASRASKAEPFIDRIGKQADWAQDKLRGLKDAGGQAPRGDAELALGLQGVSKGALKEGRDAVNAATKADYNALTAKAWKFGPDLADDFYKHMRKLGRTNRSDDPVLRALDESGSMIWSKLKQPRLTPEELLTVIRNAKNELPAYSAPGMTPGKSNHVREVIRDALAPLEEVLYKHSPELARAQATQANLRSTLPGQFDDLVQQAKRAGGPGGAADAAMLRPEVLGAVEKADPQLLQELLSRTVRNVVDKSLTPSSSTGLIPRSAGTSAKVALTTGNAGENVQKFLPALFRNSPAPDQAAEGFNRILRVIDRSSREPGSAFLRTPSAIEAGARIVGGSTAQQVSEGGRQAGNFLTRFRDNATIDVLNRPDVMERLLYISKLPEGKVTQSLILSILPQLFEERPPQ